MLARAFHLSCVMAAASSAAMGQQAGPVLTLDEAVTLALAGNRLVRNAALEAERFEDDLAATKKNRLPSLDFDLLQSRLLTPLEFSFDKGAFGTIPNVGPIPDKDIRLEGSNRSNTLGRASIAQPISQLYKIGLGVKEKELAHEIAVEKSRQQRQAIVSDVTSAYFDILEARSGLAAREESLRFYEELQTQVQHNVEQDTALTADLLDVQARRAKAEYDALVARNAVASRKERLNMLLARDVTTPFEVSAGPEVDTTPIDTETARRAALERRPEVRQARLQERQAEYDRRLAKADFIPDLSFTVNYIRLFDEQVIPTNIATAGILFSWSPFDWGKRKLEVAQKQRVVDEAVNGVSETETSVMLEVGVRVRALEEARALVHAAAVYRDAAAEKRRLLETRYKEGSALLKDLLQAQASMADADAQYQQALASFWTARAELEKSMGEDR